MGTDANGNTYHARNLDFGLFLGWDLTNDTWQLSELLRPLIMNVRLFLLNKFFFLLLITKVSSK